MGVSTRDRSPGTLWTLCLCCAFLILTTYPITAPLLAEEASAALLWAVREKGKFAYINSSGEVVIPTQFDEVGSFSEGLAPVRQKGRWGFVDTQGKIVISPQFQAVGPFSAGLARVKGKGRWGFIDKSGSVTPAPRFNWALDVREGMALVEEKKKYGYVDSHGRIVVSPRFADAGEFWEGLARVKVRGWWGFIDRTGKVVIDARYDYADNFHEGLAQVEKNGRHGYVDRAGRVIIPFLFERNRLSGFSEGLAMVNVRGRTGYIDRSGNMVVPPQYWLAWDFQEGAASVQTGDGRWILIDRAGEPLFNSGFDYIDGFHDGMARVRIFRDYGFIDTHGKLVIPLTFTGALPFSDGLAAVYVGGSHRQLPIEDPSRRFDPTSPLSLYSTLSFSREKVARMGGGKGWGYIDTQGQWVIPPQFDFAGSFRNGLAEVQSGAKQGYIDRSGRVVWETTEASDTKQGPNK
jgi:hypothetical protein